MSKGNEPYYIVKRDNGVWCIMHRQGKIQCPELDRVVTGMKTYNNSPVAPQHLRTRLAEILTRYYLDR